jgi:hypothetical protein
MATGFFGNPSHCTYTTGHYVQFACARALLMHPAMRRFQIFQLKEKVHYHLNMPFHFNRLGNNQSQRWQVNVFAIFF